MLLQSKESRKGRWGRVPPLPGEDVSSRVGIGPASGQMPTICDEFDYLTRTATISTTMLAKLLINYVINIELT